MMPEAIPEVPVSEFMQPHQIVLLSEQPDRDALLEKIERFWYSVYVEELGRKLNKADSASRRLKDEHTDRGEVVVAMTGPGEVVGTVIAAVNNDISGFYRELYQIPWRGGPTDPGVSISNKLIVKKTWRQKSRLMLDLVRGLYAWGLQRSVRYNYVDCVAYLRTLYERLGYREHLGTITHPEYGEIYSMVLDLEDIDYLSKVRSPFAREYVRMKHGPRTG